MGYIIYRCLSDLKILMYIQAYIDISQHNLISKQKFCMESRIILHTEKNQRQQVCRSNTMKFYSFFESVDRYRYYTI